MGTARRRLGTVLIVAGLLVLAYGAAVLFWRDPVTDLYSRYQQHKLAGELEQAWPDYRTGRLSAGFHAATRRGSQPYRNRSLRPPAISSAASGTASHWGES
jgi:hypothetical protein